MTREEMLEVRTNALMQEALQEMGEHLATADRLVPVYIKAYLPPTVRGIYAAPSPSSLHPRIGALVRDVSQEIVAAARFI